MEIGRTDKFDAYSEGVSLSLNSPGRNYLNRSNRRSWTRALAILAVLLSSELGFGGGTLSQLMRQLATASDFRVRLQAALELGKFKGKNVRVALERSLRDPSPAVRASAAAGLQSHGDRSAIPALSALASDPSGAVRRQAQTAIETLRAAGVGASYVVQIGRVRSAPEMSTEAFGQSVQRVARDSLGRLPGVVLATEAGPLDEALPTLSFDGTVASVSQGPRGELFAVSARVEFVISQLPGRVLKGRIRGAATVHSERAAAGRKSDVQRLRREAVEAAAASALSDAARALREAADS